MESLQQATDGDGQRRNRGEVSREQQYTEDKQVRETEPKGW